MDRRPLFLDPVTGSLTETSGANRIDLATLPWLEELILDVERMKVAFAQLDIDIGGIDPVT